MFILNLISEVLFALNLILEDLFVLNLITEGLFVLCLISEGFFVLNLISEGLFVLYFIGFHRFIFDLLNQAGREIVKTIVELFFKAWFIFKQWGSQLKPDSRLDQRVDNYTDSLQVG